MGKVSKIIFLVVVFFLAQSLVWADCRQVYREQILTYKSLSKFAKKNKRRSEFYQIKTENLQQVLRFLNEVYGKKLSLKVAAFAKMRGAQYKNMVTFIKNINEKKIFCSDYKNLPNLSEVLEIIDSIGIYAKNSKKK
ncbi:MAG: hypothetical protein E2O68_04485 [Deltaproteobacteria bacterium]|nr:MAG: hypothetical protein E2O68_04485 [Deltaproteobacteria bacterium]